MGKPEIGCLVMAAGNAVRFGRNKLAETYRGNSLIHHTLETIPRELFAKIVVVTQYEEAASLARSFGFDVIYNETPEKGISETIRLGTAAMSSCDAIVYMVADQPLLRKASVQNVTEKWMSSQDYIIGAACGGKKGNPCIFPRKYFKELLSLQGDHGGSAVIRAHPEALRTVEIRAEELRDVDTEEALEKLKNI